MLTIEKPLSIAPDFPFELIGRREDILFFDIETTGLSAYKAGLYLIGCVDWVDGGWRLTQYFAESVADEVPMLDLFFARLSEKKILISFNGGGFDIPFLTAMVGQYGLKYSFETVQSFDIYRMLKPYKKLLGMPNLKLKSCEQFLGIFREDKFSGGELIYVYYDYLKSRDERLLQTLLLHNAEDLENLPLVLPILNYHYLLNSTLTVSKEDVVTLDMPASVFNRPDDDLIDMSDWNGNDKGKDSVHTKDTNIYADTDADVSSQTKVLDLIYHSAISVPKPVDAEHGRFTLNISGNSVNLCARLYAGSLKYFYPDYKNYFYLPAEDCAVHKSVGAFVDPGARKKATAKTCYTKKDGLYLPMPKPVFLPAFYKEYKAKVAYAAYTPGLFSDQIKAQAYLRSLFSVF